MSVESSVPQSSASQSEIIPAFMLAALVAITGLEAMMIVATPHKVMAQTAPLHVAQIAMRH